MDRRNGGDTLAPPRPPKLLPRIHRPRAPEPEMIGGSVIAATEEVSASVNVNNLNTTSSASIASPQCRKQSDLNRNYNSNSTPHQQQEDLSSINSTLTADSGGTRTAAEQSVQPASALVSNNIRYNRVSCNNNHIGNIDVVSEHPNNRFDEYQIHHLTFLPQRPCSLSRNSSQVSATSSASTVSSSTAVAPVITATNTFTRRRQPPSPPGSAVPLLTITGNSGSNSNFLNHFQSTGPAPISPVTLAQPRPESERLGNEYVDTPLRTAQQLQNATRIQHPAGQHDNGQTTTHHLLLLPQRELRQQQQLQHNQQQSHHQQHSNLVRLAGTAGSGNATTRSGTDATDSFLHSHSHPQQHHINSKGLPCTPTAPSSDKLSPPAPAATRGFATPCIQPINQPITKQPALSHHDNPCKFTKELPALDELFDMHSIGTGIPTTQGMVPAVNGTTPIIIGGSTSFEGPSSLNPITCPRCDRCRCEQCQSPRPLPQTWVCNKTCLCSAESIIDYASCLCCAKALFYHCARDNDLDCDDGSGTPCVDNPCSCGPYKRTQRWGWLSALSVVLPCLWCYWPMRGCVAMCEKCYGRFGRRGCRCQQIGSTSSMFPITSIGDAANVIIVGGNPDPMENGSSNLTSKSHHHNDCNTSNRILRTTDLAPKKRLLDSSPEY